VPKRRAGLTLVELLVIAVVLGVGLMVLVPWIVHSRETGRAARCERNQQEIAQAMIAFEAKNGYYPGYVVKASTKPGPDGLNGSWVVAVLRELGPSDLYGQWEGGEAVAARLPFLFCPDDRPRASDPGPAPLDYVTNCGLPGKDTAADGVFHDHTLADPVRVSADYLRQHDGLGATLLISENLQAGWWTDTAEADLGMVWFRTPGPCNAINECRDVGPRPQEIRYARPSSFHPGIANVTYCDGSQKRLSEKIDYLIYQQQMAPDDRAAGLDGQPP
jgi:type II secretory pathway pseudopilin PulG